MQRPVNVREIGLMWCVRGELRIKMSIGRFLRAESGVWRIPLHNHNDNNGSGIHVSHSMQRRKVQAKFL